MNRFTEKLVQRLAFWRKPAAQTPAEPETSVPEAVASARPTEAPPDAAVDAPTASPGLLARLKQALRRPPPPAPEAPTELDLELEPDPAERSDAGDAAADDVSAPELSLLARIRNRFRRHSAADTETPPDQTTSTEPPRDRTDASAAAADDAPVPKLSLLARLKRRLRRQPELPLEAAADAGAPSPDQAGDADGEETAVPVGRARRVLATLSKKRVWIPAVSLVLLALMGTLTLMLLQSAQEKKKLQTELLATQKKLEQTVARKAAAKRHASRATDGATATTAGDSLGEDGDCTVHDKESVIRNLKNCIDSFNQMEQLPPDAPAAGASPAVPVASAPPAAQPLPPW